MESMTEIPCISATELVSGTFYAQVIGVHELDKRIVAPHSKRSIVGTYIGVHESSGNLIFSLNGNHIHLPIKEYELYYKESIFGVKVGVYDWMELKDKDHYHTKDVHYKSIYGVSSFVPMEPPTNLDQVVIHSGLIEGYSYKTCEGRRNHADGLYYADGPFQILGFYKGKQPYRTFDGGYAEIYRFEDREGRVFKHYLNPNGVSCFQQMNV
jgi:hypothetical protein